MQHFFFESHIILYMLSSQHLYQVFPGLTLRGRELTSSLHHAVMHEMSDEF